MFFSILIPVYNTSKYLDECVQSVLSQTEKDYEIVLIDDGSTDNSGVICDKYANEYSFIRVVHKQNEGLLMTRRRGFQEAKGDYFICLDSDDYLYDIEALEKIKRMVVNKNCDLVIFNYLMEKESREKDQHITLFDKPNGYVFDDKDELYSKLLVGKDFNAIFTKVCHRDIVDINVDYSIWDKELFRSQGEDLFQTMPLLTKAKRVGYINHILYFYRWNGGSISRNINLGFYYSYRAIYRREDEYFEIWNIQNDIRHNNCVLRAKMILSIIIYCYDNTAEKQEWLRFVDSLANDEFFVGLINKDTKNDVLPYYRLVYFFICHRMKVSLQLCIKVVSFISRIKSKGKR